MMQSFDTANQFGKEFMDSGLRSFAAISKGMQAIAVEAAEYSKRSFEAASSTTEKLIAAKSLEKTVELQADYAKRAYEDFVAQATRMAELFADTAKDAYLPFESAAAKVK